MQPTPQRPCRERAQEAVPAPHLHVSSHILAGAWPCVNGTRSQRARERVDAAGGTDQLPGPNWVQKGGEGLRGK